MVPFSIRGEDHALSRAEIVAFLAFCMACPLFVPTLDVLMGALRNAPDAARASSFAGPLALSAMTAALAFLFACLIKTTLPPIGRRLRAAAGASYAAGYAILAFFIAAPEYADAPWQTAAGLMLGFGSCVMALAWMERLGMKTFVAALRTVWACAAAMVAFDVAAPFLPPMALACALGAAAPVAAWGMVAGGAGRAGGEGRVREGSNWWDVFGCLDMSVVQGSDDFHTPGARGLFFVGVPLAMMVMFAALNDVSDGLSLPVAPSALGGVAALLAMTVLARFSADQPLINASYRFFLPAVAFASFAAAAFVQGDAQHAVLAVGGFAFLSIYAFMMAGMLAAMAGRMESLALPSSGIMVVVACLACLIDSIPSGKSLLEPSMYSLFLAAFVLAAALLVATPGSRLWRVVLEGVDAAADAAPDSSAAYAIRCAQLAERFALTPREREVLALLGRGHTSAFVAEKLVIAESTARSHRKNVYRKLGVKSREELFGLLDSQDDAGEAPAPRAPEPSAYQAIDQGK